MNLVELRAELDADELIRGYASMNDFDAAADMNLEIRERVKPNGATGSEIFDQTNEDEYIALTSPKRTEWLALCGIDVVSLQNTSPAAPIVTEIFGNPSQTRTNLLAFRLETVSRGVEIDLGVIREGHVQQARAL